MQTTYSIVEARNKFATLVHNAETQHQPVRVTRRGNPVAVILSIDVYEELSKREERPKYDFGTTYLEWRKKWQVDQWDEDFDPWADVRDRTPAPEVGIWD